MTATEPNTKSPFPVIDFDGWLSSSSTATSRSKCAADLVRGCHESGFVYIINHGIPDNLLKEVFELSKNLFDLSHEEKMLAPHPPDPPWHRGYSSVGLEKVSSTLKEYKESYEVGSEHNLDAPPIWLPEAVLPGFRTFSTSFYWTMNAFSQQVLGVLAMGLGLSQQQTDEWKKAHTGNNNQLRLLHYPPLAAWEMEGGEMTRMPAHTDFGSFTLLLQDDCGGLQAEERASGTLEERRLSRQYIDVKPMDGAIVMNVGSLLTRWSNEYLEAPRHRVTLPPLSDRYEGEQRMTRERYSIPYFVSPDLDTMVETFPSCLEGENAQPKFEKIRWRDYMRMRAQGSY
ncbi:hypothetical protein FH972_023048 [Carpinus fangiana]|uniref:Fe2OG dioxygenase domain-containing protein n=1 Tax=Carpinus fangiana TaxID=176857 RepID=A0A5N6KU11_9ROSI|nr:hypothetical protein FH972_023048 [Carpinus fangiana]